jgi:hypothetical protein
MGFRPHDSPLYTVKDDIHLRGGPGATAEKVQESRGWRGHVIRNAPVGIG